LVIHWHYPQKIAIVAIQLVQDAIGFFAFSNTVLDRFGQSAYCGFGIFADVDADLGVGFYKKQKAK